MSVKFTAGFLTQTQADALNRLFARPNLGDVWAVPPLQMTRGPGGQPAIALPPPESWWAKLTDEDAGAWTHEEWWEITPGVWEKKPLGESGTLNAYPVDGQTGTLNSIVRMWKSRSVPDTYEFTPGGGTSSLVWFRITALPAEDPGPYTGVAGYVAADGAWADLVPTVSSNQLWRAPSNEEVPLIPVDQVVIGQLETETGDDPPDSPPRYRITPWGGFFRYKQKVYVGSYCDDGNIVNVYKWEYLAARELCLAPAPPD